MLQMLKYKWSVYTYSCGNQVLLSAVLIDVYNHNGNSFSFRAFLDSWAQMSFASKHLHVIDGEFLVTGILGIPANTHSWSS